MLKIAVPFDFDERLGFFMKADLVQCLKDQKVEILPLCYGDDDLRQAAQADGILIPGGLCDIDPNVYGSSKVHAKTKILRNRYDFERKLLDQELPSQKPIFCLCWGMQMANVYFGGSLLQHLPDDRPSQVSHEQREPGHIPTHKVRFAPSGLATKVFGAHELSVNSTHHQGVERLGEGLEAEGWAEDGLVECLRLKNHPFFWAVQWHPERLKNEPTIPAFLAACTQARKS